MSRQPRRRIFGILILGSILFGILLIGALEIFNQRGWFGLVSFQRQTEAQSEKPSDTLGTLGPFFIPNQAPSYDINPRKFVMNGQTYLIPRNYIFSVEYIHPEKPETLAVISMRALLPDLSGLTRETANCFLNFQDRCHGQIATVGLRSQPNLTSGATQLENIKKIIHPERRTGSCGLEYYQTVDSTDHGGVVFQIFFTTLPGKSAMSVLRCPKENSAISQRCNSYENIDDGNSFYYIFDRRYLCEWAQINDKVVKLITSFKKGEN